MQSPRLWRMRGFLRIPVMSCSWTSATSLIALLSSWVESCYTAFWETHNSQSMWCSTRGPSWPFMLCPDTSLHCGEIEKGGSKFTYWRLGTLCGTAEDLAKALAIIEEDGPPRGLRLNRSKSLHYIPEDADGSHNPLPPEIPITRSGFSLLGSPIGPAWIHRCKTGWKDKVCCDQTTGSRRLSDTVYLALPKLNFLLRSCPPVCIHQATMAFDNMMRECLFELAQ